MRNERVAAGTVRVAIALLVLMGTAIAAVTADAASPRVRNFSFSTSTSSGGVSGAVWTLRFSGSAIPSGGTVTVSGPAGTDFSQDYGSSGLFDVTTGAYVDQSEQISPDNTSVTLTLNSRVSDHDLLALTIPDVTTPAPGTPYSAISLSTSTDPMPASPSSGAFTARGSVSHVSFHASSMAAGASNVTWNIRLQATTAMAAAPYNGGSYASNTITIHAPGTTFNGTDGVAVWDLTTGHGVAADHNDTTSSPGADVLHLYSPVRAGDVLDIVQPTITNPPSGTQLSSVTVSTSADPQPVPVANSGSFTSAASVVDPSFSTSTTAGGAQATWTLRFRTSASGGVTGAGHGGAVTITAPANTSFSTNGGDYQIYDESTGATRIESGVTVNGSTATIGLGQPARAGDVLALIASGVTNPPAGTALSAVQISTSSDSLAASAGGSGTFTTAATVGNASFSASSTAAGATSVTWTLRLTTRSTGMLPAGGRIKISAPSGTVFSASTGVSIYDETLGEQVSSQAPTVNGSSEVIALDAPVAAGDALEVVQTNVTNPSTPISPAQVSVSTSSDTAATATAAFPMASASISGVSVGQTTLAGGATGASWRYTFLNATGSTLGAGATITLTAPAGTAFDNAQAVMIDDTTGVRFDTNFAGSGATATVGIPNGATNTINGGDQVTIVLTDVTNPGSGAAANTDFGVSTSANATAAHPSQGATFATASAPTGVTVSTRNTAGGAGPADWIWQFTASSSNGTLVGRRVGGSTKAGTITLAAPSGTVLLGNGCSAVVIDATTGVTDNLCFNAPVNAGSNTAEVVLDGPTVISPGDHVDVLISGTTNPPAGTDANTAFGVQTSSDTSAANPAGGITFNPATAPADTAVSVTDTAGGDTDAAWTWQFTASANGTVVGPPNSFIPRGTIIVNGPAGSVFPSGCGVEILDETSGQEDSLCFNAPATTSHSGATDTINLDNGTIILPGDVVDVMLSGVTNPAAGSSSPFTLFTSSDTGPGTPPATPTFGSPNSVVAPTITRSEANSSVTWTLSFVPSARGSLLGGPNGFVNPGTITVAAPAGVALPGGCSSATVIDETQGETGTVCGTLSGDNRTETLAVPTGWLIAPGDRVDLALTGVGENGVSPFGTQIWTASDSQPATVTDGDVPFTTITLGVTGTTSNRSPTFTFTSNVAGSTFVCRLDGPGAAAGTPASCDSGSVSYHNLADGDYTFSVQATAPTGLTAPTATDSFTVNSLNQGSPVIKFSPKSLDFGRVNGGHTSQPQTVTVTDTGSGPLKPTVTLTGADASSFEITSDGCTGTTVAPSSSCQVAVAFAPIAGGRLSAQLVVTDAGGTFASAALSGAGIDQATLDGTITGPDSSSLEGVQLLLCKASTRTDCKQSTSDAHGHYFFGGLVSGGYQLEVLPPNGNLFAETAVLTLADGANTQDFDLREGQGPPSDVVFNGQSGSGGGPPRTWLGDPNELQTRLALPVGSYDQNNYGFTVIQFYSGPSDGIAAPSLGTLTVYYHYDASGVPRLLSTSEQNPFDGSTSAVDNGLIGHWSTGLTGAPSVGADLTKVSVDGVLDALQSSAGLHGAHSWDIEQYAYPLVVAGAPSRDRSNPAAHAAGNQGTGGQGTRGPYCVRTDLPSVPKFTGLANSGFGSNSPPLTQVMQQPPKSGPVKNARGQYFFPRSGNTYDPTTNPRTLKGPRGTTLYSTGKNVPVGNNGRGPVLPEFASYDQNGRQIGSYGGDVNPTNPGDPNTNGGAYPATGPAVPGGHASRDRGLRPTTRARTAGDTDGGCHTSDPFDSYIDPSGSVVTRTGIPVAGAKVVLLRARTRRAKLKPLKSGSTLMSPANRRNPDHTNVNGHFGWDVLTGFYSVQASRPGCTAVRGRKPYVQTPLFPVPPPVSNLRLSLNCPHLVRAGTNIRLTARSIPINQVELTATVTGAGRPSGTVTFILRGRRIAVPLAPGERTVSISAPKPAAHVTITAIYSGDGLFAPSQGSEKA